MGVRAREKSWKASPWRTEVRTALALQVILVPKRLTFACWLVYDLQLAAPTRASGWEQEVSSRCPERDVEPRLGWA